MSGEGRRGMFIKSQFLGPLFRTTPPTGTVSGFLLNYLDFMEKRASTTKIQQYFRAFRNRDFNSHNPPTYPSSYKGGGESKRPNKLTLNCRIKVGILYRSVIIIGPSLKLFGRLKTKEGERDLGSCW